LPLTDDDDYEIPDLPKKEEPKPDKLDDEEEEEVELDANGVPKVCFAVL